MLFEEKLEKYYKIEEKYEAEKEKLYKALEEIESQEESEKEELLDGVPTSVFEKYSRGFMKTYANGENWDDGYNLTFYGDKEPLYIVSLTKENKDKIYDILSLEFGTLCEGVDVDDAMRDRQKEFDEARNNLGKLKKLVKRYAEEGTIYKNCWVVYV